MSWEPTDPLTGWLLVAAPALTDPNFARAVVLILDHDSDGAIGVVLNHPTTAPVGEVLPDWGPLAASPPVVFVGGPVQQTAVLGLGWSPAPIAGSGLRVLGGSVGTLDLDALDQHPGLTDARIFAGYAGWSPGQLEAEIAEGSWYVVEAVPADAFTEHPETLWRVVLRRQGGTLAWVSLFPEDPTLN